MTHGTSNPGSSSPEESVAATKRLMLRQRVKRLGQKLGLLAGSLVFTLLALEVVIRLTTNIVPPLLVGDAKVGKTYQPNYRGSVYVSESEREIEVRFNRDGFRGPDRPLEKAPGVRRVVVFGDSMVAGIESDEYQTMVARLEELLRAGQPQFEWEVMNYGVAGSSPGQELALYRHVVAAYQPDIVLCAYFVGNDLADICHRLSKNPRIYFDLDENGNLYQEPHSESRAALTAWLNSHSRLYVWQKHTLNTARHNVRNMMNRMSQQTTQAAIKQEQPAEENGSASPATPDEAEKQASSVLQMAGFAKPGQWLDAGQWIYCRQETEDLAHAWKLSDRVLRQFRDEVEQQGGLFAVLLLPSPEQVYTDYWNGVLEGAGELANQFDYNYPDARLGEICKNAKIPLVVMSDAFRAAAPHRLLSEQSEWLYYKGMGHFNGRGHELAAREVYRFLTEGKKEVAERPFVSRLR